MIILIIIIIKIIVLFLGILYLILLFFWFYLSIVERMHAQFISLLKAEVTVKFERFNLAF